MRLPQTPMRRGGFTLVEILVVIGIIAVLASLLLSGVMVTLNKLDEVKTRNEISAMTSSLKQFQADFHIQSFPPPSRLWLDETMQYNTNISPQGTNFTAAQLQQLKVDSQAYLKKVWPQLQFATVNVPNPLMIDWNSDSTPGNSNVILEGQQCLVFFLGGARVNGGAYVGFAATNATNPMDTSNQKRFGPYFQFDTNRIQTGPNNYPQYVDPYGTVYAYFSSGKAANGYNAYWNASSLNQPDCPSITAVNNSTGQTVYVQPYCSNQTAPLQYYNPDSFQIISAGKNQRFGIGGYWVSTMGDSGMNNAGSRDGLDDIANFYGNKLGIMP